MSKNDTSRVSRDSVRVASMEPRGWGSAPAGHVPDAGALVYCTEGPAEVVRVLGRTSDGARLLELRCANQAHPFFAATSNVLVRTSDSDEPFLEAGDAVGAPDR
jgi:hypothetical protein